MDRVAELLANFPGPVTLQPSRWKWIGILAASAVLFGGGIAQNLSAASTGILAWLPVAVFGMLMLGAAVVIFIVGLRLSLDDEGFTLRVGYRSQRWRWSDVGDFAIAEYLHNMPGAFMRKRIGFNDKRLSKTAAQRVGEQFSTALTGRDCALPDGYYSTAFGLPMEDLVRLLSQWQQRALAAQTGARH
jgi:hypothetical protein